MGGTDRSNIANAILNVLRQRADEAFEDAARLVEEWAADNDPNSRALAAAIRARITRKDSHDRAVTIQPRDRRGNPTVRQRLRVQTSGSRIVILRSI